MRYTIKWSCAQDISEFFASYVHHWWCCFLRRFNKDLQIHRHSKTAIKTTTQRVLMSAVRRSRHSRGNAKLEGISCTITVCTITPLGLKSNTANSFLLGNNYEGTKDHIWLISPSRQEGLMGSITPPRTTVREASERAISPFYYYLSLSYDSSYLIRVIVIKLQL